MIEVLYISASKVCLDNVIYTLIDLMLEYRLFFTSACGECLTLLAIVVMDRVLCLRYTPLKSVFLSVANTLCWD